MDYWLECVECALDEAGVQATPDQMKLIAGTVEGAHESYGMAFYQPPASDRYDDIERAWKAKYAALERQFESYRGDAETAVKQALRQHFDTNVTIGKDGEVIAHRGRSEIIQ